MRRIFTDFFSLRWRETDPTNGKTDREFHSVSQCWTQCFTVFVTAAPAGRSVKSYIFMEHRSPPPLAGLTQMRQIFTDFFSDRWRETDPGNGKTDKELHSVSQCWTQSFTCIPRIRECLSQMSRVFRSVSHASRVFRRVKNGQPNSGIDVLKFLMSKA